MLKGLKRRAALSPHPTHFHAATILSGSRVLATAYNSKSNHAEIRALHQIPLDRYSGMTLWSVRVDKHGDLAMARPCEDCLTSMKFWGVSKMLYSISNGDIRTEDVEIALEIYRNDTRTETALNGTITYGGVI